MKTRPRTKANMALKMKRCSKCGKIIQHKVRCRTCHKAA